MPAIILAVLLWCALTEVNAAEFEVEGEAVYDIHRGDAIQMSVTNQFLVAFRNGEYRITTWPPGSSNYIQCAWDGKALRTVVADYRGGANSGSVWLNAGTVESLMVPTADVPFLPALWLAYCSSGYFESRKDHEVEPVWPQDNPLLRKQGFRVRAEWALADGDPHLPEAVAFLNDGIYRGYDEKNLKPIEIPLPPPYQEGFTNAVYRANSMTNVDSLRVPADFFLRMYLTPVGAGMRAGTPRTTLLGHAREVRPRTIVGVFLPVFNGNASVHDYRFAQQLPAGKLRDDGYVLYTATAGIWPTGADLDSQIYAYTRSAAIKQQMQSSSVTQGGPKRAWARAVILLVLCAPLLVMLQRKLRASSRSREDMTT